MAKNYSSTNYEVYRPFYLTGKRNMNSRESIVDSLIEAYLTDHPMASENKVYDVCNRMFDRFELDDEIIEMFKRGLSQKEVSEQMGIDTNSVHRATEYAKESGITVVKKPGRGVPRGGVMSRTEEVRKMFLEGKSNTEIAKTLGIFRGNVSQYRMRLRKEDIEKYGTTEIPSGRDVVDDIIYKATKGRPTSERMNEYDYLTNNLGLTSDEASEYITMMNGATKEEKENMDLSLEIFCCTKINDGMDIGAIYSKYHNKDLHSKVNMTMSYLEILKYGSTLQTISKDRDDMVYYLRDGKISYVYNDNGDGEFSPLKKVRSRELTKEIVDLILDENGRPKKVLTEGVMSAINSYIRTGVLESPTNNEFLRHITYKDGLYEFIVNFAA